MARSKVYRKSGALTKRSRMARKMRRDRRIYRLLRQHVFWSEDVHRRAGEVREPASVYLGKPGTSYDLQKFPVTHQSNGQPMPNWEDLTPWLKAQLLVMALHEWGLQTFTIRLRKDLEESWVAAGKDPRVEIRNRMGREMRKIYGTKGEYFFIIEGWSKQEKKEVRLHIHGGAFILEPSLGDEIVNAAARACGQGIKGRRREPRSVHQKEFWKEGHRFIDYLFKSLRRPDQRLGRRRLHISREAVGSGRDFWAILKDPQ